MKRQNGKIVSMLPRARCSVRPSVAGPGGTAQPGLKLEPQSGSTHQPQASRGSAELIDLESDDITVVDDGELEVLVEQRLQRNEKVTTDNDKLPLLGSHERLKVTIFHNKLRKQYIIVY